MRTATSAGTTQLNADGLCIDVASSTLPVSWETSSMMVFMALSDRCVACPARAGAQRTDGSSPAAAQRMACRAARLCRVSRSMTLHEACRPWDFKWRWFDRGAVRGLRRFGRVQRGSVRPIDNGSENGLNAIFGGPDKAVTAAVRHTRVGVPTVSSRVVTARTTNSRLEYALLSSWRWEPSDAC